jgi:hypothetical protein
MLPHKYARPSFQERHDRIVLGLADVNKFIRLLESAYNRTKDEFVFAVLRDLTNIKAEWWGKEDEYRKMDEKEALRYFDELPFSMQIFLMDEKLRD